MTRPSCTRLLFRYSSMLLLLLAVSAAAQTSDDFSQPTLDTGLWTFLDPVGDSSYDVNNGVLTLSVTGGVSHDLWRNGNNSVRVVQAIADTDLQIEAKFLSVPSQPYQLQGLLVEGAPGDYLRLDYYHDGEELRVFSTSFVANSPTVRGNVAVPLGGALWLRLQREGNTWRCFTSMDGSVWSERFTFTYVLSAAKAGVYGANVGNPAPAFAVRVDYFFDTSAPIVPEDGGVPNDTTAPLISAILLDVDATTADISWMTDELALGRVLYGLTTGYELGPVAGAGFATAHQVQLTDLTPETLYYFQIESEDASGNLAQVPDNSLTTLVVPNAPPAVAITSPASGTDYFEGDLVLLTADASDSDGTVEQVEFLVDDQVVATVTSAPWQTSWSTDAVGAYSITARARDDDAGTSVSVAVFISVHDPAAPGAVLSDDFFRPTLNPALWTFVDPVQDSSYALADGQLTLSVAGGNSHDLWRSGNAAVRVVQPISDADFEIEVKFESLPTERYQMQGLLVEDSPGNYLRLDFVSDGAVLRVLGVSFVNDRPTLRADTPLGAAGWPLWLRLGRQGDDWQGHWSADGENWEPVASFTHAMAVSEVGVFGGNTGRTAPAFDVAVDYFFNTSAPIIDEDGIDHTPPVISGITVQPGTTTADISWTTDEPATGRVAYGLTPGYELGLVADAGSTTDHLVPLSGLTPDTLYYFRVESEDAGGNLAQAPGDQFSTASGEQRIWDGLQALYLFQEGSGNTATDYSGVAPLLNLQILNPGEVAWVPGGGLELTAPTLVRSAGPAGKIIAACQASNEITIEAWVDPATTNQSGPARIATISNDPLNRNATLAHGQSGTDPTTVFNARLRTTTTTDNGIPSTISPEGTLTGGLQHVVYTFDDTGTARLYVDGDEETVQYIGGSFANWNASYPLALGGELDDSRNWLGTLHLVAFYDRALSLTDVLQNYNAGPHGEPQLIAPVITSVALTTATVGMPYGYDVEASGNPVPAYALTQAPDGMAIDPASGLIAWTPPAVADYDVTVTATNSEGQDSQAFTITVSAVANQPPSVSVSSPVNGAVYLLGDPVPLEAQASDGDGSVQQVQFLVDGAVVATLFAPPWTFSWTGGSAGAHTIVARATDDDADSADSPAVSITINDPGMPVRVTAGLVALYDFAIAAGSVVPDVSGAGTPLNLNITEPGAVSWLPGGGLSLNTATVVKSSGPATKVIQAAQTQNALTVEAWVTPITVAQNGPARIVSCSASSTARNLTLGQGVFDEGDDRYTMRFRTTATSSNGLPATSTAVGSLTAALTHVVYTRTAVGATSIYLDGVLAATATIGGDCSSWDTSYVLALGNEPDGGRPWLGTFDLLAIYDRALPLADVLQNYNAGPRVEPEPAAPVILSPAVTMATVGVLYSYDVDAGGFPAPTYALTQAPAGMTIDPTSGLITWTPPAVADYDVTVTATNSEGQDSQAFTISAFPQGVVQIQVWHGLAQRVGHLGSAQADFNVLGNVNPVQDLASLSYKVNDGTYTNLSVGPDSRRLVNVGDFNADIPITQLSPGLNVITIRAISTAGPQTLVAVEVTKETGGSSPLPVSIDWNSVGDPQDVGQYVDGHWQKTGDGLRVLDAGYDRLFLIGEDTWQDYEVLVPITIHAVLPASLFSGPAGLGILLRFTGHIIGGHRNWPSAQPKWGYQPFGGIGWLRWSDGNTNPPQMQFYHGDYDVVDDFGVPTKMPPDPITAVFGAEEQTQNFGKAPIQEGGTYFMRMRCETQPDALDGDGVTTYSWKIWGSAESEPAGWAFQVTQQSEFALRRGGFTFIAHHVEATFGDATAIPLPPPLKDPQSLAGLGPPAPAEPVVMAVPRQFALLQNVPNPFNPSTIIALDLPRMVRVDLKVYDLRGQIVRRIFAGELPLGTHTFTWDGRGDNGLGVAGGVYIYRIQSEAFASSRRMTLIK